MLALHETEAVLSPRVSLGEDATGAASVRTRVAGGVIGISVHDDLAAVESLWRAFEMVADCTAFQTFAWHAAWQKHIGDRSGVKPAIVVGRARGRILFVLPLALEPGRFIRRLVWHASDLCDYNAPLLAPDFTENVPRGGFSDLWRTIAGLLAAGPRFRYDVVVLERMLETVGEQRNPFLELVVALHPSGAYLMAIGTDWERFYRDKRSSATRRHDRSKRKRLAECGAVSFVTAGDASEIEVTLDTLFAQKATAFAARGVRNFLARPGTRDFYRAVAAEPSLRDVVHVSRLQVGAVAASANVGPVFRGRYYHILASYDRGALSRFGPGTTHLHELIAYAIQRGCREFDFTVGDEVYKRDWCDTHLALYDYRAAATLSGAAIAVRSRATAGAKRFIKQQPALWRTVCNIRLFLAAPFRRA